MFANYTIIISIAKYLISLMCISLIYSLNLYVNVGCNESSLPVVYPPGYQVLSDILFRLGLIANALSLTAVLIDCSDLN